MAFPDSSYPGGLDEFIAPLPDDDTNDPSLSGILTQLQQAVFGLETLVGADGGNLNNVQMYGVTPGNFPNWRKAVGAVQNGTGPKKILFIGTSITAGEPSTTNQGLYSVPAYFNTITNKLLGPSQLSLAAMGPGPIDTVNPDPRFVVPQSTVTSGSNNVNLNTFTGAGTLHIASNSLFPAVSSGLPGEAFVDGVKITYTGTTSTSLTGCNNPAGTSQVVNTNDIVYAGWQFNAGQTGGAGWAGAGYCKVTGVSGNMVYTPGNGEVDTFDIYYLGNTFTGNLQVTIDGVAQTALNTNQTNSGIYKATYTVTKGTSHVISFHVTGAAVIAFLIGIDAYDSTNPGFHVGNAGIPLLGTSGGWATTNGAYKAIEAILEYAPDLTIWEVGADDASLSNSVANFLNNVSATVAACKVSGDVLFWTDPVCSTALGGGNTAYYESLYNQAIIGWAPENGCGVVDIGSRFGPWAQWSAQGFNYDSIHPNPLANTDIASALFLALSSIAFGSYGQFKQMTTGFAQSLTPTAAVKIANYTAAPGDFIPCNPTSGSFTITLPTAPPDLTRVGIKIVATAGSHVVNLATGGSDVLNIAGTTTGSLSLLNQGVIFQYDAATAIWYAQSTDAPLSALDARYLLQASLGEGYGITGDTGGPTPTPAVALSTASGSIGSDVPIAVSATTKIFDTASLPSGSTWIVMGSVLVDYQTGTATVEGELVVDTATATITGLLAGEVETNSAVITQAMPFAALVVVGASGVGTLKYQIKNNSASNAPLAKAATTTSSFAGSTGYVAFRIA